jgi:hypothetical protein
MANGGGAGMGPSSFWKSYSSPFQSNHMKKIWYRAMMPTPPFFKRVIKLSAFVLTAAVSILTAPVNLSPLVQTILINAAVAATVAATVAQLTVDTDRAFLSWINGDYESFLPGNFDKELLS